MIVIDTMEASTKPLISIITATYNASEHLPGLIASIAAQNYKKFEWVIADGGSTDGTVEMLGAIEGLNIVIDSRPDYGIYDAFNRAIKIAKGSYYLVVGADDLLYTNAIGDYCEAISCSNNPDIVVGSVKIGKKINPAFWHPELGWINPGKVVTSHSVGMLIKKEVHNICGMYSMDFKQCADGYFIKSILNKPDLKISLCHSVVGEFSLLGVSNTNIVRGLCEGFMIQLKTEENKLLQVILFVLRIMKNLGKILR